MNRVTSGSVFSGESNTVGLLDMYGFESRSTNYLEQLVVNAFNEQVQSFYNQSVFQWEMVSVTDTNNEKKTKYSYRYSNK